MLVQYCTPPSRSLLGPTQLLSRMGGIGIVLKAHKKWASSPTPTPTSWHTKLWKLWKLWNIKLGRSVAWIVRKVMNGYERSPFSLTSWNSRWRHGKTKFKTNTRNKRNTTRNKRNSWNAFCQGTVSPSTQKPWWAPRCINFRAQLLWDVGFIFDP